MQIAINVTKMTYKKLRELGNKLFLTVDEIAVDLISFVLDRPGLIEQALGGPMETEKKRGRE